MREAYRQYEQTAYAEIQSKLQEVCVGSGTAAAVCSVLYIGRLAPSCARADSCFLMRATVGAGASACVACAGSNAGQDARAYGLMHLLDPPREYFKRFLDGAGSAGREVRRGRVICCLGRLELG